MHVRVQPLREASNTIGGWRSQIVAINILCSVGEATNIKVLHKLKLNNL